MDHSYRETQGDVRITPLSLEESQSARLIRNRRRHAFVSTAEITYEQQQRWYQSYIDNPREVMFAIYLDDAFVGQVGLYDIDASTKTCEFGRLVVDEAYSGRKIGLLATKAACSVAFFQLGIERVSLEVLDDNLAAIRSYRSAGFRETGSIAISDGRRELTMEATRQSLNAS